MAQFRLIRSSVSRRPSGVACACPWSDFSAPIPRHLPAARADQRPYR